MSNNHNYHLAHQPKAKNLAEIYGNEMAGALYNTDSISETLKSIRSYRTQNSLSNLPLPADNLSAPQSWEFRTTTTTTQALSEEEFEAKLYAFPQRLLDASTQEAFQELNIELNTLLLHQGLDSFSQRMLKNTIYTQHAIAKAEKTKARLDRIEHDQQIAKEHAQETKDFSNAILEESTKIETIYGYGFEDFDEPTYPVDPQEDHTLRPHPSNVLASFVTSLWRQNTNYVLQTNTNQLANEEMNALKYFFYENDNRLYFIEIDEMIRIISNLKKDEMMIDDAPSARVKIQTINTFFDTHPHIKQAFPKWGFADENLKDKLSPNYYLSLSSIAMLCAVSVNFFKGIPYASLFINVIAISGFFYNFHNEKSDLDFRHHNKGWQPAPDRVALVDKDATVLGMQTFVTTAYTVAMTSKTSTKFEATLGLSLAKHFPSNTSPILVSLLCGLIVGASLVAVTTAVRYAQDQEVNRSELFNVFAVGFLAGMGMDLWSHLPTGSGFSPHYRSLAGEYTINAIAGSALKNQIPNREEEIQAMRRDAQPALLDNHKPLLEDSGEPAGSLRNIPDDMNRVFDAYESVQELRDSQIPSNLKNSSII